MPKQLPLTRVLLSVVNGFTEASVELSHLITALSTGYGSAWIKGGHPYVAELKRLRHKTTLLYALNQLKRSNYVRTKKIGDRLIISLTQKGLSSNIVNLLKLAKPNSSGTYTVIIFDIPETQRVARRQFRLLLRQGNFKKLQQSVWVSQADTYKIMADFIVSAKLKPWVNLYRGTDFLFSPNN